MATITNATLAQKLTNMIGGWQNFVAQLNEWLAGEANGGPSGDGAYELTDSLGVTYLVKSPARLQQDVEGIVDSAASHEVAAAAHAESAGTHAANALTARESAQESAVIAAGERSTSESLASLAGNHEASARVLRDKAKAWASSDVDVVVDPATGLFSARHYATKASDTLANVLISEDIATGAADTAVLSTQAAADYEARAAEHAETARLYGSGALRPQGAWDASTGSYPTSPAVGDFWKISAAGVISGKEFAVGDMLVYFPDGWDKIDNTETVTSVAGKVGAISLGLADIVGLADALDLKTDLGHSHAIADVIGLQNALNGKAAKSHSHAIADVTGLQAALDAAATQEHTHAIADVTGLQTALNGKASTSHGHIIGNISGLQAALDAKAPSIHGHAIEQVSGLRDELSGKAALIHTHLIADIEGLTDALDYPQAVRIRLSATSDASPSSTAHAFQIGPTSGTNLIIDNNEMMARQDGAAAPLALNFDGGVVRVGPDGIELGSGALLTNAAGAQLRVDTDYGELRIGPANTSWCHFSTDRGKFYFSKPVHANGGFQNYSDRRLKRHLEEVDLGTLPLEDLTLNRFDFLGTDKPQRTYGIYAQDAQAVAEWMTEVGEDGKHLVVNEARIALAAALKALHVLKKRGLIDG